MAFPGPQELGRWVVVGPGQDLPAETAGWPKVVVDDEAVHHPGELVEQLHHRWLHRSPTTIVLAADPALVRKPEVDHREPWELDPSFEFSRERLQFLLWANSWDLRSGEPIWWWGRKAQRCGARPGGPADVLLADGTPAWIDGGPRGPHGHPAPDRHLLVHRESVELGRLTPDRWADPTTELAGDQLAAVRHATGAARVIAPAGSGKTRVLTERLRHLLDGRGWQPESVCAVAFNLRAAEEMRERTNGLGAHIRTLNSLALAICNGTGGFARPERRGRLGVIEEPQVRTVLDQLIDVPRAANTDPFAPYLEGLRAIRLGLVQPAVAEESFDAPGLADLYPRLRKALSDEGVVDFDGQVEEAIAILLSQPEARQVAQRRCRHLLVDEFQDLTPAHLLMLRLLAAPGYEVFGVGDDDQVIYGFSGATPEFLLGFDAYFPAASHYALEVNYRCPPSVITAAKKLLSYNTRRVPKTITPAPLRQAAAGEFTLRRVGPREGAGVATEILRGWAGSGTLWEDMALLVRVNSTLLPFQVLLSEQGIPCRKAIGPKALDRTGIRTALAYLRIALDPSGFAGPDVAETIRRPSRRLGRNVVDMASGRKRTSLAELKRLAGRLHGGDSTKLDSYIDDLEAVVRAVKGGDTAAALRSIRLNIGLGEAMGTLDGGRTEVDRSTHGDDLAALEQVAALHPDPFGFESWLREVLSRPEGPRGVELSTVHRVKGREWDRVIVAGVDEGLLPHHLSGDEAEERRILHVALTRAREQVVVLASTQSPSPMVAELDGSRPRGETRSGRGLAREPEREGRRSVPPTKAAPAPSRGGSPAARSATGQSAVALEALKAWRRAAATREGVPAYVVFNDEHLEGIAATMPADIVELMACRGVGPLRLERYGDEVLAVLDQALGR